MIIPSTTKRARVEGESGCDYITNRVGINILYTGNKALQNKAIDNSCKYDNK